MFLISAGDFGQLAGKNLRGTSPPLIPKILTVQQRIIAIIIMKNIMRYMQ